jgi:hypothetical protein
LTPTTLTGAVALLRMLVIRHHDNDDGAALRKRMSRLERRCYVRWCGRVPRWLQLHRGRASAQNNAWSVADLGKPSTADLLRIVINAAEPGSASGNDISLEHMFLTIWSPAGVLIFTSADLSPRPQLFPDPAQGTDVAGDVFKLDATDGLIDAGGFHSNPNNRFGLAAELSAAGGGMEAFYLARVVALGAGLAGLVALRRRRR